MRLALLVFLVCAAWPLAAQQRVRFTGPPAAGERPGGRQFMPRGGWGGFGGWWMPWWGDGTTFDYRPLRPPVDPPKESPVSIRNPDYETPRYQPETRDYPEGSLPQPRLVREDPPSANCIIREASGREFAARDCRVFDDWVTYRTPDGRRHRATLDLARPVGDAVE